MSKPLTTRDALASLALRHMQDGVAVLDADGVVLEANPALEAVFDGEPVTRRPFSDIVECAESSARVPDVLLAVRRSGGWRGRLRPRHGGIVWDASISSHEADGDVLVAVLRDITVQHHAEQARMDLLSMVTHDIKGPLTVILGYTDLLTDPGEQLSDSEVQSTLGRIHESATQIDALVANFVELARIEAGRLEVARRQVDLTDVVRGVCERLTPPARRKGITIAIDVGPLPPVLGDAPQLERVFANILGNAIKYTKRGGRIAVSGQAEVATVRLAVRDTGVGIEAAELPHVFERYRRAGSDAGVEGTGLGLFIARTIVEAHGGDVDLESTVGKGSTVTVCLPLA